jgi:hypothetical protein
MISTAPRNLRVTPAIATCGTTMSQKRTRPAALIFYETGMKSLSPPTMMTVPMWSKRPMSSVASRHS